MRPLLLVLVACGSSPSEMPPGEPDAALAPESGFRAEYFDRYRVLAASRVEATIDHTWEASPVDGVGADRFSARFTGTLRAPATGTYTFAVDSDDGVRLSLGDALVIDDWRGHFPERHTATVDLTAGEDVNVRLDYFELDLGAKLRLAWTPPGGSEELLDGRHVVTAPAIAGGPKPPYANPVLAQDCPDPGVLAVGDTYYAICTGGRFRIRRSYDLVMWEDTNAFVFPSGKPPYAANGNRNWAPEMHEVDGKFLVYYTSVNAANVLCVGVASASSPMGPFTDRGSPLVEHPQGVIDATYVRAGGKHYLVYKIDGNSVGQPTPIYLRELAPDGMSFAGSAQVELIRNNTATWEGGVVEAPWIVEHDGMFYLFYSGNVYDARYRTGVARAANVAGPYTKYGSNPILRNDAAWVGPGHGSVVAVGAKHYFVYHAWENDGAGGNAAAGGRQILVDEITWGANGWPKINDGTPSETSQVWPGEAR